MYRLITASHNKAILDANLAQSPCIEEYGLTVISDYDNVAQAYNSEPVKEGDINIFVHHDVYLPPTFINQLTKSISELKEDWDVLGVAGVYWDGTKKYAGYLMDRGRKWKYGELPQRVATLDELILITKESVRFDEQFNLHFYGADLCMGKRCFAIQAYCHHNSGLPFGYRSESFRECENKFAIKYSQRPLITTCSTIL